MNSLKSVSECCDNKGNFSSITFDLLPKIYSQQYYTAVDLALLLRIMADMLHKAIQAMSLEEEEPLTLPDDPRFRVIDENETSLLGRLLNPDCQSMARMIEYMPTA